MKYVPKEVTEEVNVTPVNPLVNLAYLLGTVSLFAVAAFAVSGMVAGAIAARMSPETEVKIGEALSSSLAPNVREGDRRVVYLDELVGDLQAGLARTEFGSGEYPPVTIHIIETPIENAMVTAGSHLFVTDGLLASVESENELAFVLAHELGHLHHRDPVKALGRSLVWMSLSTLLGVGGNQVPGVVSGAINLQEMSYGRSQETAADRYGLEATIAHYGHGGSSLGFFERMQEQEGDWGPFSTVAEWQQTHPLSKNRIQRLEAEFEQQGWSQLGKIEPLPEGIECPNFEECEED